MLSDITYKNFYDASGKQTTADTSLDWSVPKNNQANAVFEKSFYIKDGTTVAFDNIPYGVSYTITETQPADDKYNHAFAYTDSQDAAKASGSISDDADTVTITNTKNSVIDIGVVISNAPYLAMIVLAGAVVLLFVYRRRDLIGE